MIAPTLHCRFTRATENTIVGERSMGDARLNYEEQIYAWFDYLLKDQPNDFQEKTPRVQYYTMGSNQWQSAEIWPPKNTVMTTYYLTSEGDANSRFGDGGLERSPDRKGKKQDEFYYDPLNPVTSYGGGVCCTGNAVEGGSFDQREMEEREDILVYTSALLKKELKLQALLKARFICLRMLRIPTSQSN